MAKKTFLAKFSFSVHFSIKLSFIWYVTWYMSENHPNRWYLVLKNLKKLKKNWKKKFRNFSFLIEIIYPKSCPTICLMSWLHDYIRKKYVTCIPFAHQGLQKAQSVVRYPVVPHGSCPGICRCLVHAREFRLRRALDEHSESAKKILVRPCLKL